MVALLSAEGSVCLHDNTGTIEMRPDEKLDIQTLQGFLASKLPNAEGQLQLRQFATGAANLTYLLRYHNAEFVLRRPPLGSVAPGSHDMQREYTILNNLYQEFPLAPRVYFFYADDDIIGAPFFVMERRAGYVINDTLPRCIAASNSKKTELAWMMIDTLAELHRVDPDKVSLGHLGQPNGFAQRQLDGWIKRWRNAEGQAYAGADEIISLLEKSIPNPQCISLLHNDFKLNNIIVTHENPCKPSAVVDWDMCTRGDPLFDLGLLLTYWTEPGDNPLTTQAATMPEFFKGGFPSRLEAINRYAKKTNLNMENIHWYMIFGIFKLMGILQQIYIRYQRGQTKDLRFKNFDYRIRNLIIKANDLSCSCQK